MIAEGFWEGAEPVVLPPPHLEAEAEVVHGLLSDQDAGERAVVFATSGTTGKPKGVELPHSCWTYEGVAMEALQVVSADDIQAAHAENDLSYLAWIKSKRFRASCAHHVAAVDGVHIQGEVAPF